MKSVAIALALLTACTATGAPRYALRAGEKIEYRRTVAFDDASSVSFEEAIHLYILDSDASQAHVLAIRNRENAPTSAVHFRVNDRGQITIPEETRNRPEIVDDLLDLFPTLAPAMDNPDAWTGDPDLFGCVLRQRRAATEANSLQVRFSMDDPTGVSSFLGDSAEGVYWFDLDAGLMTRLEVTRTTGGRGRKTVVRYELIGRESVDSAWLDKRRAEWDRFMRTQRMEDALRSEIETQPARVEITLRRLERVWGEYLAQPPRDPASPLRRVAEMLERRAVSLGPGLRERAALAAPWLDAPAAQWSLQDATGVTITSESVRKGTTLECFWSAASPPSLRMFAVLERLRTELPKTPVSIICINVDTDVASARRAAEACNRGLTTVFSGPPIDGDAPAALPIVRILDETGRVRRVHSGWRATLAGVVSETAGPKSSPPRP